MSLTYYALAAGVAALITFVFSIIVLKVGHRFRLYPKIRSRDVHTRPTPRLGGIAMFVGVLAAFFVASQVPQFALAFAEPGPVLGILGAALIIVLIGVADDLWDLDWLTKLAGQMIAGGILAWQGVQLLYLPIGGVSIVPAVLGLVLTVLSVVLVMNAVNFIDGLDGLVAGVAIIANIAFFIYSYTLTTQLIPTTEFFNLSTLISATLIGVCAGFLPLNWHPAKLFMGDAGALLIGLLMATSAILVTGQLDIGVEALSGRQLFPAYIPILLPLAVLVVPLLDFSLAVIRRVLAGKSPFSADRKHLHHRLLDMGHRDVHATLIFYAWTTVVSIGILAFIFIEPWAAVGFIVAGMIVCTAVTFAPLTRRKAVEQAVQSVKHGDAVEADVARYDPLDAAADRIPVHDDSSDELERSVLDALVRKDPG